MINYYNPSTSGQNGYQEYKGKAGTLAQQVIVNSRGMEGCGHSYVRKHAMIDSQAVRKKVKSHTPSARNVCVLRT